jgi:hypothetical protein
MLINETGRWRRPAEEARALAKEMNGDQAKEAMLRTVTGSRARLTARLGGRASTQFANKFPSFIEHAKFPALMKITS